MILTLLAGAGLLVWLYLLIGHGAFWRLAEHDRRFAPPGAHAPAGARVVAVVPARDEADVIAFALQSLLRQEFSGRLDVVLVDDESSDGTAEVARAVAEREGAAERLTVLQGRPEQGWTGKLAAMNRGFSHVMALPQRPDYVLFCDADIGFGPQLLERLVAGAQARGTVLASLMVKLRCESVAERWFVPAFIFFFQKLYPFSRVNDPESRVAAAAGGVMLVRPDALERAGGLAQIRGALIDDCALGKLMKREGPIWLGLTDDAFSLRPYANYVEIESMVTRSAYAQLRYSPWRLAVAVAGMGLVYLAPPLIVFSGREASAFPALVAYLLMAQAYMPTLRFYGLSRIGAFALPLVAACYTWFTLLSAWRHGRGRGGAWKGRYQAP
ncbi:MULTISPECIES: glycosyltransferase [Methylosinus]|uniref:Glycosyl transferase family 2 n=1 Tax=Methylosinus trichosporium (strain ATCC 35070 / NCIMB 11131 / UNIQEM 75 / OB3b) TaxID=595536 RepID=A0A2D2D0J9_METT3|nr:MULTISPECIES: glycosyltransferase [Methylosinus]ATQ68474.1 glycosyl transferase family 2 [Methylosinus trichosporium OB3b]OBS53991.1 glycosyl transferase family 2 [Methylosinus sp. 3S-1]